MVARLTEERQVAYTAAIDTIEDYCKTTLTTPSRAFKQKILRILQRSTLPC